MKAKHKKKVNKKKPSAVSRKPSAKKKKTAKQNKNKAPRRRSGTGKAPAAPKRRKLPISAVRVKRLAFECENLTAADAKAALGESLTELLEKHESLNKAWQRGQFLRNVYGVASIVETVSEAAMKLKLESGQHLRDLLDTDREIANIWDQKRLDTKLSTRAALLELVKEGNIQAMKIVENYLHDEVKQNIARINTDKMMQKDIAELFGVNRVMVNYWEKQGLPRNADGSYNLRETIGWHTEFLRSKASGGEKPSDKLRDLKSREKELDLLEREKNLLDRSEVIEGLLARWDAIVGTFRYKARELSSMVHGQTVDSIEDILGRFFEDIQQQLIKQVPECLQLPPEAAEALIKVYEIIGRQNTGDRIQESE